MSSNPLRVRPDQDAEIRLSLGQRLEVTLMDLPSAGYLWSLRSLPTGLSLLGVSQLPAEHHTADGELLFGGGISRTFELKAKSQHAGDLVFEYGRPWEDRPLRHIALVVSIDGKAEDKPVRWDD